MFSNEIAQCSHLESTIYKCIPLKRCSILRRVENTCKSFQEKPLPPLFKSRLVGPPITWKVFNRLQGAAEYAESSTKDCMIFSFEERVGHAGQRKFLVAHPEHFWHNYRSRPPEEKCSYEVIRENFPCKLYFDLEYYTALNTTRNGNNMTEIFIKCVIASMHEQHGLLFLPSDFLWLDSSNYSKFSSHLVLQMKDAVFQDNAQAGTFVQILLSTMRKKVEGKVSSDGLWPSWEEIRTLLVKTKKETEAFFCDEAVYSRNRNFRIYLSTKCGKKCPLVLSPCNKYVPRDCFINEDEAIFYASLITYFRNDVITKFLTYAENVQPSLPSQLRRTKNGKSGVSGCTSSPFPELDSYILTTVSDHCAIGFIRKWTYFSKEQKVIYDIGNYRFCGNIGRHHKSNNIRIVVDLQTKRYSQACLDPECRRENYQSESRAIPGVVVSSLGVPDDFFDGASFASQLEDMENGNSPNSRSNFQLRHGEEIVDLWECDVEEEADVSDLLSSYRSVDGHQDALQLLNEVDAARPSEWNLLELDDCYEEEDMFLDSWEELDAEESETASADREDAGVFCESQNWDAFFEDDSAHSEGIEKHTSCAIPSSDEGASSLGSISPEEEMLMAEAADATEVSLSEDMFFEETLF